MKAPASDKDLLDGIIRSDVPSYEAIYVRYYSRLLSFVKGMLKDSSRAEDVTQNVFMKLWAGRESLDASLSLRNYLFVLAKNEILNIFRSKGHTAMTYSDTLPESRQTAPSVESAIEYAETNRAISRIIDSMPERRREVFLMSRYQHRSVDEIASTLNLSPRTVEKHIELALKEIRRNFN